MEQIKSIEIRKIEQFLSNIRVLKELSTYSNPRNSILKSYKGFGGLKQCFNSKGLYGILMSEIRAVFGREQEHNIFNSIKNSCNSAYYTPKEVINFIYRYLSEVCQFKGGDILEPSCGNGAFFEYMPNDIMQNSKITGIELDQLTSKIVDMAYSKINIISKPIQDVDFTNLKYDLIIGNPPYAEEIITDNTMPDINNFTIHNYFIAKCIRLLKPNGILAFVMPAYYMDTLRKNTRSIIDNEAVLIDCIRLPENLFTQATITVDVIFLRRTGKKIHNFTDTSLFEENGKKDNINKFWQDNPHRILGTLKLKWIGAYNRYVTTCITEDKQKVLECLANYKFDDITKNNFKRIIGNDDSKILSNGVLDNLQQKLTDLKNYLASLEMGANNLNKDEVIQLHNYSSGVLKCLEQVRS